MLSKKKNDTVQKFRLTEGSLSIPYAGGKKKLNKIKMSRHPLIFHSARNLELFWSAAQQKKKQDPFLTFLHRTVFFYSSNSSRPWVRLSEGTIRHTGQNPSSTTRFTLPVRLCLKVILDCGASCEDVLNVCGPAFSWSNSLHTVYLKVYGCLKFYSG